MHCDSQAAIGVANNQSYNGKRRHIRVRHAIVRDLIRNNVISLEYVKSERNIADPLTKGLCKKMVYESAQGMGLKPIQEYKLWDDLIRIRDIIYFPWLVCGDFNNPLNLRDKLGAPISSTGIEGFKNYAAICGLSDIKYDGYFFTWNNKQSGGDRVFKTSPRVRRLLGTSACGVLYRDNFSDIQRVDNEALFHLREFQEKLHASSGDPSLSSLESTAAGSYRVSHTAFLSFLRKKSKLHWLKDGDANTSFFHQSIRMRRKFNSIHSIQDENGICIQSPDGFVVPDSMHDVLCASFSDVEIQKDMFSIDGNKAPDPDGFYKSIFQGLLAYILLLKCISKLMCSRLKLFLYDVISPAQGAFVAGRQIVYNILVCQDIVKRYTRNIGSPKCMIKIDLRKAYESILWPFVEEMFLARNFPKKMWGLRQGDTLSPLLFVICMEYLSRLLILHANEVKSSIYVVNVKPDVLDDLVYLSIFKLGKSPFNYLGVPISSKKLNVKDCEILVDKFTLRVRSWGSKTLSYAGRVQLVLLSMHSYWASIFILPKAILRKVVDVCRQFLWNTAYVAKYVWNVASKANCLWVKWLDHVYMQGVDWWSYSPPKSTSCSGYKWLQDPYSKVNWDRWVWNRLNVPRHSFICWLAVLGRLRTTTNLFTIGVSDDDKCTICAQLPETHTHLFFECPYSRNIIGLIKTWLGISCSSLQFNHLYRWIARSRNSKFNKATMYVSLCACLYQVWMVRN
ncbi:uncharacterized protein [Spinacia oleracea]|uniref:Reverse transcriptase domain-containing protein n=1 Tax=Spinacia oleracea TaxID=3562 RepID=A0ABM3RGS2_SPIOL|nr:uncharacterized protein LOC130469492 [Spinacia oleracea]